MKKRLNKLFFGIVILFLASVGIFLFLNSWGYQSDQPLGLMPKESPNKFLILKIALLTDVHNSWDNLKQTVNQVNQGNFDMVIFLGDLTDLGSPKEFEQGKKSLDVLKIPYYIVAGNHDIWYAKRYGKPPDAYFDEIFADKFPHCFEKEGINFIVIDNSDEKKEIPQKDWQRIEICLQKDMPAYIFLHEPLYHPANDRIMGKYSENVAKQAKDLLKAFCDEKIKLVVAGHLHSFSKYFYDCPITNNFITNNYKLPMIVSGAVTQERNFQSPRFLQLTIFNNGQFEEKEIVL